MSLMKINELFHFEKGSLQSSKCTEGEFVFITASSEWKTHNEYTHDCEALIFAAAASGSLGRTHYVNDKFISSDLCFIITAKDPQNFPIDLKFYHMIFNEFKNDIVSSTKAGTSKEAIGMKAFGNYKLPYFNIDKQIETKIQFVNMQHSKIGLNKELTHQLDLIKQLRQAFLREAMQGKLVTAVRSSGVETQQTGQQLLAKIKAEKAQLIRTKKLKSGLASSQSINLVDDYVIPENWKWSKADEIFFVTKLAGFEYSKNIKLTSSGEIPVIRAQNVRPLEIKKTNLLYIDRETSLLLDRCSLTKKCLLVTFIGAGIGDVSTFNETERWHLAPNVAKMEPFIGCEDLLNVKFINYFLMSNIGQIELFKHVKATAQPSLSMGTLRDIDIPLPPTIEQEQIVAKLEELMAFCDGLEQSIKESEGYNEMLLQQVLREALQPKEKV